MITMYLGLFLAALAVLGYCLYQAFMIMRGIITSGSPAPAPDVAPGSPG